MLDEVMPRVRRTREENIDTISESDVSSIYSFLGDPSLGPSSVTSISPMLSRAKIAEFITGLVQLFRNDDDIRGIVWKAFERSRDELKFDRLKIERNFSRLLGQYANELKRISNGPREKIAANIVRNRSQSLAIQVLQAKQPAKNLQDGTEIITNQPVENLMLNRLIEETNTKPDTGPQNRKSMSERDGEEEIASSNESGGEYGSALQAASYLGDESTVQLLLDKGADINGAGGKYGSALQAAAQFGHTSVVELLLDRDADINRAGGPYGSALQAAIHSGHTWVIWLLLDKGADVNVAGGPYGSALQAASHYGHRPVVELLLDKGADVNVAGGKYGSALQAASHSGHRPVVELLLDKGADVNVAGGKYGSALQAASHFGHRSVVRLLLDKGADVNVAGGKYGSALQAASHSGHKSVVQLLLENGAKFVRNKSHSVAIEEAMRSTSSAKNFWQDWTGINTDQPVEKQILSWSIEETNIKADTGSQNRKALNERDGGENIASSDGSEASNMDEIPSDHFIETVEAFLISGRPFANLKRRFRDFVEPDVPHDDTIRDSQPRDFSSNMIYGEGGKVRIQWQCMCGHQFQEDIVEHKPGAAEAYVRHMHWNATPIIPDRCNLWPWLTGILAFLNVFPAQGGRDTQLHESWWGSWQAARNSPPRGFRSQPSTAYRDDVAAPAAAAERFAHFVCICIRHMSRAKYLHHAEATPKEPRMDDKDYTDRDMFNAIQRCYTSVRPWWKRLLFCARLSSVRYYEFRLFYNPENEVNIEEDWYDRFPENSPEGEWHYIPKTRDSTPYLLDRPLFHYVRYPEHVPPGNYFWNRIPKVRQELSCQNDPERTGWGLVMKEEWHQTAFLICWVPVVATGAIGSGIYCFYAGKPVAIGVTIFSGILAIVVWFYQLAQGYAKQGSLL